MKEITRIHLAATPYNIEIAAKKDLEKYIAAITKALGANDDALREIEARMVELLGERGIKGDKVITNTDVVSLREHLGAPGDFTDDDVVEGAKYSKRLMRDTERGMLGGVLSGFAAYTGVDVVWWRIAAVILGLVSLGTSALLYVVLWIVMPAARTAAERLQMRGLDPSLENIHEEANREVVEVPVRKKPFVVVLRVLGILTLLGMIVGSVAILALGVFGTGSFVMTYDWLANSWLIAAAASGAATALLFIALVAIGVYGLWAWRATRVMAVAAGVIIVAGLAMFATTIGTAFNGALQVQQAIKDQTQTYRVELGELANVKALRIATTKTPVEYHVTTGAPYAEVELLQRNGEKLPLKLDVDGVNAVLKIGSVGQNCQQIWTACNFESASVKVYGPALDTFSTEDVSAQYHVENQDKLSLTLGKDAVVSLHGRVTVLDADLAHGASVTAENIAVSTANLKVDQATSASFGMLRALSVATPDTCGDINRVKYERAEEVTVNGVKVANTGTRQTCLDVFGGVKRFDFDDENDM